MTDPPPDLDHVVHFYDTHPIHEAQILENIRAKGIPLESLTEEVLKDHDQDHFGGLGATDILVEAAGIGGTSRVLDVCSGVGGPARYLAHRHGCHVTGIDLTQSRHDTAVRLTKLVGLDHLVDFRCANALAMPFDDETFDVVIGQEAWAHVPDKAVLVGECVRVLRRGGRIAFTDILVRTPLPEEVRERLTREMAFNAIASLDEYRRLLTGAGCVELRCDDLSAEWTEILKHRLAMYRSLKATTIARFGEAHFEAWDRTYSYFVGLFAEGTLGGGRLVAERTRSG
jgi:ubiquinone/menaquinone biosynthesis C-methylase UbiE